MKMGGTKTFESDEAGEAFKPDEAAEERRRALVAQFGTDPRDMTAAFTDGRTTKVIQYANPLDVPAGSRRTRGHSS